MQKASLATKLLKQAGFSLVEVLLAVSIFGMITVGLIGAMVYGRGSSDSASLHDRASLLAEEGVDAVRNIAGSSYASLAAGTYGLTQASGRWALSGTSDTTDVFTRKVTLTSVSGGLRVDVNVTWPQLGGNTGSITLSSQVSNWLATIAPPSWANPTAIGSSSLPGAQGNGMQVATTTIGSDQYAIIITSGTSSNFIIVKITNPAAPVVVSTNSLAFSAVATAIAVNGSYVYVGTNVPSYGMVVYNISNPAAPSSTTSYSIGGTVPVQSLYVNGSYLYMTRTADASANEFTIFSLSNPAVPASAGSYNPGVSLYDTYVYSGYAFVATGPNGMYVLSVATPSSTTLVSTISMSGSMTAISGYNNRAFIAGGQYMYVYDLSTPISPHLISNTSYGTGSSMNDVANDNVGSYFFTAGSGSPQLFVFYKASTSISSVVSASMDSAGYSINGIAYNPTLDVVVAATTSLTQRLLIFGKG